MIQRSKEKDGWYKGQKKRTDDTKAIINGPDDTKAKIKGQMIQRPKEKDQMIQRPTEKYR